MKLERLLETGEANDYADEMGKSSTSVRNLHFPRGTGFDARHRIAAFRVDGTPEFVHGGISPWLVCGERRMLSSSSPRDTIMIVVGDSGLLAGVSGPFILVGSHAIPLLRKGGAGVVFGSTGFILGPGGSDEQIQTKEENENGCRCRHAFCRCRGEKNDSCRRLILESEKMKWERLLETGDANDYADEVGKSSTSKMEGTMRKKGTIRIERIFQDAVRL